MILNLSKTLFINFNLTIFTRDYHTGIEAKGQKNFRIVNRIPHSFIHQISTLFYMDTKVNIRL